jgi:hypothetical protein
VWNIGVHAGGSGLVIIDCDLDKDKPSSWYRQHGPFDDEGIEASRPPTPGITDWLAMCEDFNYDPDETLSVVTPSGGIHYYYEFDQSDDYVPPSVGYLAPLVDVRAGGAYVVTIGSEADGGEYEIANNAPIQPIPKWLLDMLLPKPIDVNERSEAITKDIHRYNEDRVKYMTWMLDDIRMAPQGQRNVEFAHKVYRVLMSGGNDSDLELLVEAGRDVGLSDREMKACLASARRKL